MGLSCILGSRVKDDVQRQEPPNPHVFFHCPACSLQFLLTLTQMTTLKAIDQTLHISIWIHKGVYTALFHMCSSTVTFYSILML